MINLEEQTENETTINASCGSNKSRNKGVDEDRWILVVILILAGTVSTYLDKSWRLCHPEFHQACEQVACDRPKL